MKFLKTKSFLKKYERVFIPLALVLGIIPDIFFFALVDFDFTVLILGVYLVLAAFSIVAVNFYEDGLWRGKLSHLLHIAAPYALQFFFGALFTAFVLFYSFSGSLLASWPFISVLLFLVVANEVFKKYNTRPDIDLAVFFFALFSYLNLAVPYLLRNVGPEVFILSGVLSLLIMGFFVGILLRRSPGIRKIRNVAVAIIGGLFIAMNVFYFTNVIPPIPLSLRDIGIYYHVERAGDGYRLIGREKQWWEGWRSFTLSGEEFRIYGAREVYAFSAVFAPPGMDLGIIHEWQMRSAGGGWLTRSTIPFPITGGRSEGFRGFSKTQQIEPGLWRVNIKTNTGQIIGQLRFRAVEAASRPEYSVEIK